MATPTTTPAPFSPASHTRTVPTLPTISAVVPERLRWRAMRGAFRIAARLSDGIALGYRHGFDAGPMLDYIYRDETHGTPLIGRFVDRCQLNQIGWRAIRARRVLLDATLAQLIADRRAGNATTHIVDIAAGPGRYVLELVARLGGDDLSVTCRDLDPEGFLIGGMLDHIDSLLLVAPLLALVVRSMA